MLVQVWSPHSYVECMGAHGLGPLALHILDSNWALRKREVMSCAALCYVLGCMMQRNLIFSVNILPCVGSLGLLGYASCVFIQPLVDVTTFLFSLSHLSSLSLSHTHTHSLSLSLSLCLSLSPLPLHRQTAAAMEAPLWCEILHS